MEINASVVRSKTSSRCTAFTDSKTKTQIYALKIADMTVHGSSIVYPNICKDKLATVPLVLASASDTSSNHRMYISATTENIVSAHRQILGMASVVCGLVKRCVSSISL